ncbi:MAG: ubiquinol-cytochrome C chaperone family protein [Methyloligella sp. ZOD6]
MAQARLPVFYASIGVPDTLEGRLSVLTMHIFAVLHRLKAEGAEGHPLAQELVDLFSADMDTVLREMGVSDLKVPKRVRDLCAKSHGIVNALEQSYGAGEETFRQTVAELLPVSSDRVDAASRDLSAYLQRGIAALAEQPFQALRLGEIEFPEAAHVEEP